jgi:hypothetical protein
MTNDDEKDPTLGQTPPPKKKRTTIDELLAIRDNEHNVSPRAQYKLSRPFSGIKKLLGWRDSNTNLNSETEKIQSRDSGRADH